MMALTDRQFETVRQAATMLPVHARDSFLRSVAGRLSAIAFPTDYDVSNAVNFVLNCRGIAVGQSRHKEQHHARR
jgi:hypothetical protein